MANLASQLHGDGGATVEVGTVVSRQAKSTRGERESRRFSVRIAARVMIAERAASCLLDPEPGDRVLCARADGDCYVLAVLRRNGEEGQRWSVDGDLRLDASGKVTIAGRQGVEVTTPAETRISSGRLQLNAVVAEVLLEQLDYVGSQARVHAQKLKLFASELDSLLGRAVERVKRSYRFVEELDHTRARQIDMTAQVSARIHADSTTITASELIKLDGKQVHIG